MRVMRIMSVMRVMRVVRVMRVMRVRRVMRIISNGRHAGSDPRDDVCVGVCIRGERKKRGERGERKGRREIYFDFPAPHLDVPDRSLRGPLVNLLGRVHRVSRFGRFGRFGRVGRLSRQSGQSRGTVTDNEFYDNNEGL
jgi:hypothetical protein